MRRPSERDVWRAMRSLVLDDDRRRAAADALEMSYLRVKALQRIAAGPVPMSELANVLGTDRPYTTIVVDDLEQRGLASRVQHPGDRRAKIVTATAAGRRAARRAATILERPPVSLRGLSDRDLAELHRLLLALLEERC